MQKYLISESNREKEHNSVCFKSLLLVVLGMSLLKEYGKPKAEYWKLYCVHVCEFITLGKQTHKITILASNAHGI